MNNPPSGPKGTSRALPPAIWALGLVSLLMDTSSELVHSLLPVVMSTALGASMITIGIVEGIAEGAAMVTKAFSGVISDRLGKRKLMVVLGYGLSTLSKPLFPLANSMAWIFTARFADRIGKGIRGAPRDALVADLTLPELRGAAYGLRQSLDTIGAVLGPLLALAFMAWLTNDIQAVLWIAVVPACLAVGVLIFAVHEPTHDQRGSGARSPLTMAGLRQLPFRYWLIVLLGAVFTLARFSEAFLVLRAQDVGLALGAVPMVLIMMNVVYAVTAYPAGIAADRFGGRALLVIGLLMLVAADLALAAAVSPPLALLGAALWGLHMGLTQGLFSKLVADAAPAELRGTAFGFFNLVSGTALLPASVVAGLLWSRFGAPGTFMGGAVFATLTLLGLLAYRKKS